MKPIRSIVAAAASWPGPPITVVGAQPVGSMPAQFVGYLKRDDAKWREVVRAGRIKLD